ncbi:hypothetical protein FDECE_9741, partial [Fusarium decemcellulare]
SPAPPRGGWVGTVPVEPMALDLPRKNHVRRDYHLVAANGVPTAGPGVVANDVEAEARQALSAELGRLRCEEDVRQIVTSAKLPGPPSQRGSPTLPGPSIGTRIYCSCGIGGH